MVFDQYAEVDCKVLVRGTDIQRIRVTCKCGCSRVYEMPLLLEKLCVPVLGCENCNQEYVVYQKQLIRRESFKLIEGVVVPPELLKTKRVQQKPKAEN